MQDAFEKHLQARSLIRPGERILLGLSGGADSTCLLHLLTRAKFNVVAAHLNHGLRSDASADLEWCQSVCDSLGVPLASGEADVRSMAKDLGTGLEDAGRRARQQFLRQAAFRTDCHAIATGHNQDDHVESILLHLIRGSGLSGLAGISERENGLIRPLLPFTRQEIRDWCASEEIGYLNDPMNEDESLSRVRIRRRILPDMAAINPGVLEAITRLGSVAREDDQLLNGMAAAHLEQSEIRPNGVLSFLSDDCEVMLDRARFESAPSALQARGLRLAAGAIGGSWSHAHIRSILQGGESGSQTSEGGLVAAAWDRDRLHLQAAHPVTPFRSSLPVPGDVASDEFGWVITAETRASGEPIRDPSGFSVSLDAASLQGGLHFRTVQAGDRISPLGMEGSRLVADVLGEMKLTKAARSRLPIICDLVGPVWIPAGPLANRARVSDPNDPQVCLTFGPLGPNPGHNVRNAGPD